MDDPLTTDRTEGMEQPAASREPVRREEETPRWRLPPAGFSRETTKNR